MRAIRWMIVAAAAVGLATELTRAESESGFELPVQLIGFPVIILAVRLSNFIKKLAYAVNPSTYQSKSKRSSFPDDADAAAVEKRLVAEMGPEVCVFGDICREHAEMAASSADGNEVLDWETVFRRYQEAPANRRRFYMLSVFLGDIVASPELCVLLVKRGRACNG